MIAGAGTAASVVPAAAHPHILITARTEVFFGPGPTIEAVRHIWQFDFVFSAYAVQGYDTNNDGALTVAELAPLAELNVESLADFDFFTWISNGTEDAAFFQPSEYWLDVYEGLLTLFYTLPLAEPLSVDQGVELEVFDPEYYVAIVFDVERPVTLIGAPSLCQGVYRPPVQLDDAALDLLAAVPAEQRELPPALAGLTSDLGNIVEITCY